MQRSRATDRTVGESLALVRYLRDHCEWDARQTPTSLLPYLLEEAHEVADAVRRDDEDLAGELGDLLLNVAYQVVLAEERGSFDASDVVRRLVKKMVARHPHVYGDAGEAPDWERLKAEERASGAGGTARPEDPLAGIPAGLEPLSRALRVQERAAAVGFDWPDAAGAIAKLREEIEELEEALRETRDGGAERRAASPSSAAGRAVSARVAEEAGDLLFAVVNVCRLAGAHPLTALDQAAAKFSRRFRHVVERVRAAGADLDDADLSTLDRIWDEVKAGEPGGRTEAS